MGLFGINIRSRYYGEIKNFTRVLTESRGMDLFSAFDATKRAIVHLNDHYKSLEAEMKADPKFTLSSRDIDDITADKSLLYAVQGVVADNAKTYVALEKWIKEAKASKLKKKSEDQVLHYCDKPLSSVSLSNSGLPELLRTIENAIDNMIKLGTKGSAAPEGKVALAGLVSDIRTALNRILDRVANKQTQNLSELKEAFSVLPSEELKRILRIQESQKEGVKVA